MSTPFRFGKHKRIKRFFTRRESRRYLDLAAPTQLTLTVETKPTLYVEVCYDDGKAEHVYTVDLNKISPALLAREITVPVKYQYSYSHK